MHRFFKLFKNLMTPFHRLTFFKAPKKTRATTWRPFTFNQQVPKTSRYLLDRPLEDKKLRYKQ